MDREKLDLLNRQEFVDRMLTIAQALSEKRKNACYAINGGWGIGKTFAINMFVEQAKQEHVEGEELPRYLIFRYNCWEYDYYDEPIISIVAALLDQIDDDVNLLNEDTKKKTVAILKAIGNGLAKKGVQVVEEKIGIPAGEVYEIITKGGAEATRRVKESHEYDQYFEFKKHLRNLQKTVASLAEDQTVIFIVDELDRCLPEYTIKVLERLHHLFDGVPNVQVILAIDIGQLGHVVKQIYGAETDTEKYLKKFVSFQLRLDSGNLNDRYESYFEDYVNCFDAVDGLVSKEEQNLFIKTIFTDQDIRTGIGIIEKAHLIHTTFFENSKLDYAYLCMEVLLVYLEMIDLDLNKANTHFRLSSLFDNERIQKDESHKNIPKGLKSISDIYRRNRIDSKSAYLIVDRDQQNDNISININCVWGVILYAYRMLIGFDNDDFMHFRGERKKIEAILSLAEHTKKFWSILDIIQ